MRARVGLEEMFHSELWFWYSKNRANIRANYPGLAQRFLDYNAPLGKHAKPRFLREPQAQALEIYVFLKERMVERTAGGRAERAWSVHEIFEKWYQRETPFAGRAELGLEGEAQATLRGVQVTALAATEGAYRTAFERMRARAPRVEYGNYIFALTMGTGKTLLMATCIFYDFLMASAYPKDKRYAHNALIFAPDKTVLATLRTDIERFDRQLVVPPEYRHVVDAAEVRFLEQDGATLTGLRERYNIVVSNAQKIILKRQTAPATAQEKLFAATPPVFEGASVTARAAAAFDEEVRDERELVTNQRFEALRRMAQLGVFIDEAHHAFGNDLKSHLDPDSDTSLRRTVDELAASLERSGTRVVGCYNYTGTPYAGGEVFPEVVYAYGLKRAIDERYLKDVEVQSVDEGQVTEKKFLKDAVRDFLSHHQGRRYEGMLAKLAIFVPKIENIDATKRILVDVLAEAGLDGRAILVNVGDDSKTSSDDIRDFNLLDTPESTKQFILLVGKGKEGWNCRSLFGVVLYRKPKSKVFVLQATMRCLRAIDAPHQHTGRIYLSDECKALLDAELQENYKLSIGDLRREPSEKQTYDVRPVRPIPTIGLARTLHLWTAKPRHPPVAPVFRFSEELVERYRVMRTVQRGLKADDANAVSRDEVDMENRPYSALTLVAEVARYLQRSPLEIESLLERAEGGLARAVEWVSRHNALLYDEVVPKVFQGMYELQSWEKRVTNEVALVREPPDPPGFYRVHAEPTKVVTLADNEQERGRSFHLDHYCFDSKPEMEFFLAMLRASDEVDRIYFTGMLTHGQTEFVVDYIDPITQTNRSYYPDFLVRLKAGGWLVIEVKGDDMKDDPVVRQKAETAHELADASRMEYRVILGSQVEAGESAQVLLPTWMDQFRGSVDGTSRL